MEHRDSAFDFQFYFAHRMPRAYKSPHVVQITFILFLFLEELRLADSKKETVFRYICSQKKLKEMIYRNN